MGFITKNVVGEGERLIYKAKIHWIYVLKGFVWLVFCVVLGFLLEHYMWREYLDLSMNGNPVLDSAMQTLFNYPLPFFLFSLLGIVIFFIYALKMYTSEVALTNTRLIYKTGWINVEVDEIEFSEILGEKIHHGPLGKFLGCGSVHMDARFIGDVYLPFISKPYKLLRALHKARGQMHDPLS
ncbi:MAG: PH domain-containing protein [Rhodospirillales bacterium]|nr:PH domain-containing protein [Rhodospirillales bacterium]MCB9979712.1 PH domain-containing protein [Rhodospirillales bacterium]